MAYEGEQPQRGQQPDAAGGRQDSPGEPPRDPIAFAPRPRPQQPSRSAQAYQPPPFEALPEDEGHDGEDDADEAGVIGADDIPPIDAPRPPIMGAGPPPSSTMRTRQRIQYVTEGGRRPPNRRQDEMPKVYRRGKLLAYWYVPVAVLLAVGIAWGVVLLGDQIFGDDEGGTPADDEPTPVATVAPTGVAGGATTGTPGTAPAGNGTPGAGAAGTSTPEAGDGEPAVVSGTAPDCLNIRSEPGTSNQALDCLADGTAVSIVSEPQTVGGISWVRITTAAGHDGWVAEEYLVRQ